jgi:hypothetical protein
MPKVLDFILKPQLPICSIAINMWSPISTLRIRMENLFTRNAMCSSCGRRTLRRSRPKPATSKQFFLEFSSQPPDLGATDRRRLGIPPRGHRSLAGAPARNRDWPNVR